MPQRALYGTLASGTILDGRYHVDRVIGSGGYASVYRAIDTAYNVERAIKELTDPDPGMHEQFRLEADLLINLQHPNIPRGYNVFESGKCIYFVMDFVHGRDLEELLNESLTLQRRPLDEARILHLATEICGALSALHHLSTPVIHRDVKPGNIKVTPEGRPILIDFGLAKLVQRPSMATAVAAQGVSPGFAPPEQYMAKGRTDARTDLYGLGATIYACLTGKDPAEAPARLLAQTGVKHGSGLEPPRTLNPRVSARTEQVILKALELSPAKRYQSAKEMEAQLQEALMSLSQEVIPVEVTALEPNAPIDAPRDVDSEAQTLPIGQVVATSVAAPDLLELLEIPAATAPVASELEPIDRISDGALRSVSDEITIRRAGLAGKSLAIPSTSSDYLYTFLSYTHEDRALCEPFAKELEGRGVSFYFDQRAPQFGHDLGESIERELEKARALIVFASPASLQSRWVREEINIFFGLMMSDDKIDRILIPVTIKPCSLPPRLSSRWGVNAVERTTGEVIGELLLALVDSHV